jgi:hypothetical protein
MRRKGAGEIVMHSSGPKFIQRPTSKDSIPILENAK